MNVVLIGAGACGAVIAKYLAKEKEIAKIFCLTNDFEKAREWIDTKNSKIQLGSVDAAQTKSLVTALKALPKHPSLIINASLPQFNERIMEAALEVSAHYQDLCSYLGGFSRKPNGPKRVEQLAFHRKFQKRGLIGLINTGVAPGLTNLLAAEASEKLDSVDALYIRILEEQKAREPLFTWSIETTIDDVTAPPIVYRHGRLQQVPPFSEPELYRFPSPLGVRPVYQLFGDEIATLPHYLKAKYNDFKSGGADIEIMRLLSQLGFLEEKSLPLLKKFARAIPNPKEMLEMVKHGVIEQAVLAVSVEASGKRRIRGKMIRKTVRLAIVFPDIKKISKIFPGANYISFPTGICAVAFSKIISAIKTPGVFPPEVLPGNLRRRVLKEIKDTF